MNEVPEREILPKKNAAKKGKPAGFDPNAVLKLRWDLNELPSSQHRAGLAGLALCVGFLKRKHDRKGVCEIDSINVRGLTLAVDRLGMQSLFDDVYDASLEEQLQDKKQFRGKGPAKVEVPPKREELQSKHDEKSGLSKQVIKYVYDQVVPRGAMIDDLDEGAEGKKPWLKLWRDILWATTHNRARGPYQSRADGVPIDDGGAVWDAIQKHPLKSAGLASTFALGAEETNDDAVPLTDKECDRFLLRFWRMVASIYVLRVSSRKEPSGSIQKPQQYAIAVPDVANLEEFVSEWPRILRQRSVALFKFRPRESIIDIAGEAALDVARRSLGVLAVRQGAGASGLFRGVDVFHIDRGPQGSSVYAVSRVDAIRSMVDEYARVRAASYGSSVFRRQRISNVLDGKPWWSGFARLCATTTDEMTIRYNSFRHDCWLAFTEVEVKEDVPETEPTLEHLIFRRVQAYVLGKTERKYDLSWQKVQGNAANEGDYQEKKEKVAREAFLAIRSRTGADFVAYFTSTLCSVPHHTSERKYIEIARALMDPQSVEQVRCLTLLALSAVG
ncbi:MAG: type I-MYXAN CRISPR-associated protein Cmx8 [Polyangiaceae bacterium]